MFIDNILEYEGNIIRPPSEAESLILQVTVGCTDNVCTFCPAYKNKQFRIKDIEFIRKEFERASEYFPDTRRIFLADGDAIAIPQQKMRKILNLAKKSFPKLRRIAVYASSKSLQNKSIKDLIELKALKLGIIYLGVETGDPFVYKRIKKYGSPEITVTECLKVKEAGIKLNTTIILGLGGEKYSEKHAVNTAVVLNEIKPDHIAALTLMVVKGTEINEEIDKGEVKLLNPFGMLKEQYLIIKKLDDFKCLFFSNHASNYYPIAAKFPFDKERILTELNHIIEADNLSNIKPEVLRGL